MATNPTIQQGSQGAAVKKAQKALKDRGFLFGAVDGLFGAQTKTAVVNYQALRSSGTVAPLAVDGIVGPKTWARLDPPTIQHGASGDAVKLLQELLTFNGFPVAVDGAFGPATETAVKAFQVWFALTQDGIVGPHTWTALGS